MNNVTYNLAIFGSNILVYIATTSFAIQRVKKELMYRGASGVDDYVKTYVINYFGEGKKFLTLLPYVNIWIGAKTLTETFIYNEEVCYEIEDDLDLELLEPSYENYIIVKKINKLTKQRYKKEKKFVRSINMMENSIKRKEKKLYRRRNVLSYVFKDEDKYLDRPESKSRKQKIMYLEQKKELLQEKKAKLEEVTSKYKTK